MKDNEFGVILEDINSKLDRLAESMSVLATEENLRHVDTKVDTINSKADTIQAAVIGQTAQINDHENRILSLEVA